MDAKDIIHTYAPTTNRQLVAAAIAEIVHKNPDINLTGVCGGLQSIMACDGHYLVCARSQAAWLA
ncbi:hypothetical protein [Anaplasma phagocytophilum]|nr:hypothetical protein [Anaplasma phagocytophilum]AGR79460.1 hypothetical protein YYU_03530 [Anaplasma phagocytophilum str. HZ2]AGR80709.1 hypothetical protein WSQ_03530 [Anaplasma phagocytophilum str. JM]AGR81962.1 hypothetical protein YYY_03525 [Anaplasma phagocytophilum str. Dog2]EOA61046.1 hypothetical protein HGE1_03272 [Anaplasma phagocytophilum str. HGE1]EOA62244.1 hypothetical protein CRT38_03222 [Anaplasma phagocytophilum str. CRT38]